MGDNLRSSLDEKIWKIGYISSHEKHFAFDYRKQTKKSKRESLYKGKKK